MNPVSRAIAAIVAVLAVVGAVFFGLVVLVLVLGLGLLFWLGIRLRIWWGLRRMPHANGTPDQPAGQGKVIDAEYTVISRRRN